MAANYIKSKLFSTRESLTPALRSSAFLSRGVLTPEEFVSAGDELVFRCPTWSWEGARSEADGEAAVRERGHLPPDKQYLVTRNVPCSQRVDSLENAFFGETEVGAGGPDGAGDDWLMSHVNPPSGGAGLDGDEDDEFDVLDVDGTVMDVARTQPAPPTPPVGAGNGGDADEYADMADFEEEDIAADDAAAEGAAGIGGGNNILRVRSYDISITYDKYYQTPRVWLFGYDEDRNPLAPEQMYEDVMSDYVKRTVTIENHPHIAGPHISVHPCQHGNVMKNIIGNLSRNGGEVKIESYLFIFLKFVSSIVPTINYDFTMKVAAR